MASDNPTRNARASAPVTALRETAPSLLPLLVACDLVDLDEPWDYFTEDGHGVVDPLHHLFPCCDAPMRIQVATARETLATRGAWCECASSLVNYPTMLELSHLDEVALRWLMAGPDRAGDSLDQVISLRSRVLQTSPTRLPVAALHAGLARQLQLQREAEAREAAAIVAGNSHRDLLARAIGVTAADLDNLPHTWIWLEEPRVRWTEAYPGPERRFLLGCSSSFTVDQPNLLRVPDVLLNGLATMREEPPVYRELCAGTAAPDCVVDAVTVTLADAGEGFDDPVDGEGAPSADVLGGVAALVAALEAAAA